jgi:hypothetical protein
MAENHWMTVPLSAALAHLPPQPPADPNAPGPFAFADPGLVKTTLSHAGFTEIETTPYDLPIGGFTLEQAVILALRVGPLGRLLIEAPAQRPLVTDAVREALSAHVANNAVWLDSATWIVTAVRK